MPRSEARVRFRQLLIVDRDPQCRVAREIGHVEGVTLVTQDWGEFFDQYLAKARRNSREWHRGRHRAVASHAPSHVRVAGPPGSPSLAWPNGHTTVVPAGPGTPYDVTAPDQTRYVSYADWICPTHCIEPAICPVIRAPRSWEMADALTAVARKLDLSHPTAGPVLFVCEHRVYGVGMFDVAEVLAGDAAVVAAGSRGNAVDVLVGTVSSCHGAVNLLHLG